jgi:hypothetical protein
MSHQYIIHEFANSVQYIYYENNIFLPNVHVNRVMRRMHMLGGRCGKYPRVAEPAALSCSSRNIHHCSLNIFSALL